MFKYLIIIFISLNLISTANSKPMWEISETWACKRTYSTRVVVDDQQLNHGRVSINSMTNISFFFDFKNSKFIRNDGMTQKIINKKYIKTEGREVRYNLIELQWVDVNSSPLTVTEEYNGDFLIENSNYNEILGELWASVDKCVPAK
jgi:hypothetical protein